MPIPLTLPVAVIGGGPVGLAAAAHLVARGIPVKLYEAGPVVAANVREWGHVRLFSPWRYNVDAAAKAILLRHGWEEPAPDHLPTGAELYAGYLKPLAECAEMAAIIEAGAKVTAITRQGADKVSSKDRESRPFVLSVSTAAGRRRDLARAVIDASGTWNQPNPLGAGGVAADGEHEFSDRIAYGLPDVLGRSRNLYAGKTTLVVGAGYSAADVLLDLAKLQLDDPQTTILWATRSANLARVYGAGATDQLPARGELGVALCRLVDDGTLTHIAGFPANAIGQVGGRLVVDGDTPQGPRSITPVDRIVVATGQRPDLSITRELRLELDPWLESVKALGPLIDPNLHSCGDVPPHGHRELAHPEPGFYTIGIKSYGRAPTFLLLTGYEQARSVAAAVAGDIAAADDVQLVLPETGVCVSMPEREQAGSGCCGGPAPAVVDACCADDAIAKQTGKTGCGCKAAA